MVDNAVAAAACLLSAATAYTNEHLSDDDSGLISGGSAALRQEIRRTDGRRAGDGQLWDGARRKSRGNPKQNMSGLKRFPPS